MRPNLKSEGNFCQIKVVQYGYDMKIQRVTYKLACGYSKIGTGYTTALPGEEEFASDQHFENQ